MVFQVPYIYYQNVLTSNLGVTRITHMSTATHTQHTHANGGLETVASPCACNTRLSSARVGRHVCMCGVHTQTHAHHQHTRAHTHTHHTEHRFLESVYLCMVQYTFMLLRADVNDGKRKGCHHGRRQRHEHGVMMTLPECGGAALHRYCIHIAYTLHMYCTCIV